MFMARNAYLREQGCHVRAYIKPQDPEEDALMNSEEGFPCRNHPSPHLSLAFELELPMAEEDGAVVDNLVREGRLLQDNSTQVDNEDKALTIQVGATADEDRKNRMADAGTSWEPGVHMSDKGTEMDE